MLLREWLYTVDPVVDVQIWTQDDDEEPYFEGNMLEIPWVCAESRLMTAEEHDGDPPIYITSHVNKYGVIVELVVINIMLK